MKRVLTPFNRGAEEKPDVVRFTVLQSVAVKIREQDTGNDNLRQRDIRDPEALGKMLLSLKKLNPTARITDLADELGAYFIPSGKANVSCVERYGRPEDVEERWERIQTR